MVAAPVITMATTRRLSNLAPRLPQLICSRTANYYFEFLSPTGGRCFPCARRGIKSQATLITVIPSERDGSSKRRRRHRRPWSLQGKFSSLTSCKHPSVILSSSPLHTSSLPRRPNIELEDTIDLDEKRIGRAKLFGLSALPLAVGFDFAIYSLFEAQIEDSIIVETLSMVFAMQGGWAVSWILCLQRLHRKGDPLTDLAARWSRLLQKELGLLPSGDVATTPVGSMSKGASASDPEHFNDALITSDEWTHARQLNRSRIQYSYYVGFFTPVSLAFGIAPFVSIYDDINGTHGSNNGNNRFSSNIWDDSGIWGDHFGDGPNDTAGAIFQPSLLESVLQGNPDIFDVALICLCAGGAFWAGRQVYRSWTEVQKSPPTNLPLRVALRAAAAAEYGTKDSSNATSDATEGPTKL